MTDHELIANIHRRMDSQDEMLREISEKMTRHIATEESVKPALDELITLYKGSKMIIPLLSAMAISLWAVWSWAKDHIK